MHNLEPWEDEQWHLVQQELTALYERRRWMDAEAIRETNGAREYIYVFP